jgi:hypothetical protein
MSVFVYSPVVKAYIGRSNFQGDSETLDISEDLVAGKLTLREKGIHTFGFRLQNAQRKYDGKIMPMDRIVVAMSRVGAPLQVFSGYMNNGPVFSVWPRVLDLSASCTLKKLQFWYWDPSSNASQSLIMSWQNSHLNNTDDPNQQTTQPNAADGGLRDMVIQLLVEVVGWPAQKIHIGAIPDRWFDFATEVGDEILKASDVGSLIGSLGGSASSGGSSGVGGGVLSAGTYGGVALDADQAKNATTIFNVGSGRNLPPRAMAIAIGTAMQESKLHNLNYGDRDSVGLFQQRTSQGWGSVEQIMDPQYSAGKFYDALIKVPGWQTLPFTQACQKVQRSGFPNAYAKWESMANSATDALIKSGQSISNAGSLTTGAGGTGALSSSSNSSRRFAAVAYNLIASKPAGHIRYRLGGDDPYNSPDPRVLDCLTGDTIVHTVNRGPVPISTVDAGDEVWSWDKGVLTPRKVVQRMDRPAKQTYLMRSRGRTVRATAKHRFLVAKRGERRRDPMTKRWLPVDWRTEWMELRHIRRGDLVLSVDHLPSPTQQQTLPDGTPITPEVAWLLGEFVGDGSLSSRTVNICAFKPEARARIAEIVERTWGERCVFHDTQGVMIYGRRFRSVIQDLGLAVSHASQKRVPHIIKLLPYSELRSFLEGYGEADGWLSPKGHQTYSSCSRELIDEVRALHIALGDRTSNVSTNHRIKPITIKGRLVKNALPLHTFIAYLDHVDRTPRRHQTLINTYGLHRVIPDRSFTVERILEIREDVAEPTYDIEVEGSHNFLAGGFVAHNCSSLVDWVYYHTIGRPLNPNGGRSVARGLGPQCVQFDAELAKQVKGALLFIGSRGNETHVEVSLGNGMTVGARTDSLPLDQQVSIAKAGRFTHGGLLPGLDYHDAATTPDAAAAVGRALGITASTSSADEFGAGATVDVSNPSGGGETDAFNAFVNVYAWGFTPNPSGDIFAGPRAMMNDEPILPYISNLMGAAMRSWCAAPNGDFMAWFPDYFDIWGTAGRMDVRSIELQDFTVEWWDQQIVTHQYVVGVPHTLFDTRTGGVSANPDAGGQLYWQLTTQGIATMDFPQVFRALFGQDATAKFVQDYLSRFGGRPNMVSIPSIQQGRPEFFMALYLFMQSWANQFRASVPLTFMPELWPGMLLRLPEFNFQAYVNEVTHSFQFGKGGFFLTDVNVVAPARLTNRTDMFGLLPLGGTRHVDPKESLSKSGTSSSGSNNEGDGDRGLSKPLDSDRRL